MDSSQILKRLQIKKYESQHFNLLQLIQIEEYIQLSQIKKQQKCEKIVKQIEIKSHPNVYISRAVVQLLEGLQQFLVSELSLFKIEKNKYNLYWQFLESSYIFTWIEAQIYKQDENCQSNCAFSAQILRIANYFAQSSEILLENKEEEIYKNWVSLFDYFEKIITVNSNKINKHKDKCLQQYFCLGYMKNIITSFKKNEKYQLSQEEAENLQEITSSIINQKMRDYLLDDDDGQENSIIQENQLINGTYFTTYNMREIQQSAEFNTIQNSQSQQAVIKLSQSPKNIVSSQNIKESFLSLENIEIGGGKNEQSNRQSYQNGQSDSQYDSNTNNYNTNTQNYSSSGLPSVKNKEQSTLQLDKDNLSIKTNSSNKVKVEKQLLVQQGASSNLQQQQLTPAPQPQNQKSKRDSILLPSSQFEFQSNIKNGGIGQNTYSINGSNQNPLQENTINNSYSSQFLCKDDEIFNQNGENIAINNGFFSRKVSDNLLDDLDQIDQEDSPQNQQSYSNSQNKSKSQHTQSQLSESSSNSSLHSNLQKSINPQTFKSERSENFKQLEKVQEIKLKKYSQDSQPNGRTREFSFKCDLMEFKKENSVKTISQIENYVNQELLSLNQFIDKISNEISYQPEYHQQQEGFNPSRSSIHNIGGRKSKVRGSNLPSDISAYDIHSSRVEDDITNSEQDESDTNNSQNSFEQQQHPAYNKNKRYKMERYMANGIINNDEILMDPIDDEEDQNESSSFENKVPFTRNRSNVYIQNQILKSRNSHLGEIHRPSLLKKDMHLGNRISKMYDQLNQNQEGNSESFQNYTHNLTSENNQTTPVDEYEQDQFDQLHELNQIKQLTQEELDQIREEIHSELKNMNINLDDTLVGSGIAKNYKKFSFPLQISQKDNSYKRRLQEKYKLIQNYQHLLGFDSNIFANDQNQQDQICKVILPNNKEYLKMMNKLPEDESEKLVKKKKSIEEIQIKYQNRKQSYKKYFQQITTLKKMNESGLDFVSVNQNKQRRESSKLEKNTVSIKKHSEQPDYNSLTKRKSQEQMTYNPQEDEIDEQDQYFYDQSELKGFSHQVYAINKHNYFKEFKEQSTEGILNIISETMEDFINDIKEEEFKDRSEQLRYKQDQTYMDFRKVEEFKVPQYNLNLDINQQCIKLPLSQLAQTQQYSWNKARLAAEEKKQKEQKTVSPVIQPLRFKKSVIIQEDQLNEIILRQKNLSSSPQKKQQNQIRKSRKRSGSFNPEANFSQEDENQFSQTIRKFQQQQMIYNKSMTLALDKGRLSLLN